MDNKKQQQNFTRSNNSKACQSADSNRKTSDLQVNKPWPRNTRRREQTSAPRNEPQRNSKQSSSAKVRPNVDKRPRPRGGGGGSVGGGGGGVANNNNIAAFIDGEATTDAYHGFACANDDIASAGTGLASPAWADGDSANEAVGAAGAAVRSVQHDYYELNSVYTPGSKKQNLNHLLNFHYAPRDADYSTMSLNMFGRNGSGGGGGNKNKTGMQRHHHGMGKKKGYNKEEFLQANFQFVIKSSAKPLFTASPDTLIKWDLIEQINIQTTEEPQCPICLYPPIAAKLTRCGHAYCWPCILHYLALSDKKWRKCPICYEAIHTADLKSTTIVQQRSFNVGDEITFQLMRRRKGSMYIEKYTSADTVNVERYPQVSGNEEAKLFSKFLIAKRADILQIIERERRELLMDEDATCPEFVFIQQALDLLKERRDNLCVLDEINEQKPVMEVKEDETEISDTLEQLQPATTTSAEGALDDLETGSVSSASDTTTNTSNSSNSTIKYYYFYQCVDGQNIYLHPLNVKMLQACYGTLDHAPLRISARILQKEHHSMDEDHRRKFTCLAHLPLTCQFAVVEVELQPPMITEETLQLFKNDLLYRKKERQRRDREERKRERQINEINDRQMGKLIASAANLNLNSSHEFPTCGFEEPLFVIDAFTPPTTNNTPSHAAASAPATTSYSTVAVSGESPRGEIWSAADFPSTFRSGNAAPSSKSWAASAANAKSASIATNSRRVVLDRSSESETLSDLVTLDAMNLSDVLAQAISQQKQNANKNTNNNNSNNNNNNNSNNNSKKNKKSKKMLPVFSTGMNFNGN